MFHSSIFIQHLPMTFEFDYCIILIRWGRKMKCYNRNYSFLVHTSRHKYPICLLAAAENSGFKQLVSSACTKYLLQLDFKIFVFFFPGPYCVKVLQIILIVNTCLNYGNFMNYCNCLFLSLLLNYNPFVFCGECYKTQHQFYILYEPCLWAPALQPPMNMYTQGSESQLRIPSTEKDFQ